MIEPALARSPLLLSAARSRLLIVDMQDKLLSVIPDATTLVTRCLKLLRAAKILEIPSSATEQYSLKLGSTVAELAEHLPQRPDKLRFSCCACLDWTQTPLAAESRQQVVIAGIEAHVCVLQTAFDLLSLGFEVYVVIDAVGSRHELDYKTALQRISAAGGNLVTTEMVLFEWCEVAGTDVFKQISQLVKENG